MCFLQNVGANILRQLFQVQIDGAPKHFSENFKNMNSTVSYSNCKKYFGFNEPVKIESLFCTIFRLLIFGT